MPVFGKTTIGANSVYYNTGNKRGSKFTLPEDGIVTAISIYATGVTGEIKFAIYADENGKPGELIYGDNTGQPMVEGWNTKSGLSIFLPAGDYWLCWDISETAVFYYDSPGYRAWNPKVYTEPWSEVWEEETNIADDREHSIYAEYVPAGTYSLTIETTEGGTTDPSPGTYSYDAGTAVEVTAIPYEGYRFDHWELDGTDIGGENPISIIIDANHALLAVFVSAPAPPPGEEVFNPCTELEYPFQGRTGSWMHNGEHPYAEAVIVSDGDQLPDGQIVKSFLSGRCTRLMSGFTEENVRGPANFYAGWLNPAGDWNLNGLELLKVRLFTNKGDMTISLYVTAAPWHAIAEVILEPGTYPVNEWFEVALDLRSGGASPDELSKIMAVCLYFDKIGDANKTYVLTEYWTVQQPTGPAPLGCKLEPESAVVDKGQLVGFTATAWGGTPPYTIEWILNGSVVKTDTTNESTTYNFSSDTPGTYELYVRVTDSSSPLITVESKVSTIVVKAPPPPREPCRPLHVEGNLIKDDVGRVVHLHGVNVHGLEDHPYGHWIDSNGIHWNTWDLSVIREMLDGLVRWGVNCIRCHNSVAIWKGNYGNIQANFKTLLAECLQRGIYVILDFYDVGYYNMGGAGDPVPWRPENPDFGPIFDVTGYSSVTWDRLADVIPDIPSFVEFWRMIAEQLRDYPNVIFELWNEPHLASGQDITEGMTEWFNAAQQCIDAIRSVGANQLIIVQWGYGVAYYPWEPETYSAIPWFEEYASKLTDPAGNLVISTHCYRAYDGFGRWQDGHRGYTVEEITEAFTAEFLPIAETYPLIIGEIGAGGVDEYDAIALENALDILGQHGVHYTAFWFFPSGVYALLTTEPNYTPTDTGLAVIRSIEKLTPLPPPPPPPIPVGALLLLLAGLFGIGYYMSKGGG